MTICLSGMIATGTTQATVLFDSISNTGTPTPIGIGGKAVSFTIASGTDYTFDSLDVVLSGVSGSSNVEFSIWSNETGTSPIALKILDFTIDAGLPADGNNTYTAASSLTLTEGSTYWIVAQGEDWEWDGASTAPSTGTTAGATFGSDTLTPSGWTKTSGVTNAMTINATAVPEPSTSAFLGLGLIGLLARRRRA